MEGSVRDAERGRDSSRLYAVTVTCNITSLFFLGSFRVRRGVSCGIFYVKCFRRGMQHGVRERSGESGFERLAKLSATNMLLIACLLIFSRHCLMDYESKREISFQNTVSSYY